MNNDRSLTAGAGGEALLNLAGLMANVSSPSTGGRGYHHQPPPLPPPPLQGKPIPQRIQTPHTAPVVTSPPMHHPPGLPLRFNHETLSVSPVINQRPPTSMLGPSESSSSWLSWELQEAGLERGRSRNWTYEETLELIHMYTSDEWQDKFSSEKKNHKAIWASLAQAIKRRKEVTGDEARQRLNNLKALYNRIKRQLLTGEISTPQWEYWDPLHTFLGRPQPILPLSSPIPKSHTPHGSPPCYRSPMTPHGLFNALGIPPTPRPPPYHEGYVQFHPSYPYKFEATKQEEITLNDGGDDAAEFPGTSAGGGGGGMGLEDTTSPPEHFLNDSMAPTPQHPIPPPASNRPESYKLCHNNHLSLVLEALAADESFMDVTLTAQGKSLKAHKSVLSAVSPYFRGVLKDNPCQHPIIIMPRDVKYDELNNIISYIYRGEMTVATEDLPSLLKTAEILQVTGLSPSESMPGVGGLNDTMSSAMQSPVPRTPQHKGHQANKHTSASSIQSLDSTSNSDIIVPADFMDVNLTCVKEEIANLEETTINNTDEDNTTTNTNTENNDDSIIEDDDDDGGDDPVENHRPPAKRRRTNPKSPDTNDTTTTNNTDADPKPNQCPYCETSPKDYNAIMDHMKEKHSNKKPFICSNCCRIYIKNDPYSEHVKACPKAST